MSVVVPREVLASPEERQNTIVQVLVSSHDEELHLIGQSDGSPISLSELPSLLLAPHSQLDKETYPSV